MVGLILLLPCGAQPLGVRAAELLPQKAETVRLLRRSLPGLGLIRWENGLVDLHAAQTLEPAQDLFPVLRHGDQPHMIHFHDSHQPFTTFSTINSAACSRWLRAACFMVWHSWAAWSSTC